MRPLPSTCLLGALSLVAGCSGPSPADRSVPAIDPHSDVPIWAQGTEAAVPQPADVDALYRTVGARIQNAPTWSGLLVCLVIATTQKWDDDSKPDLGVVVTLGEGAPVELRGDDNATRTSFALAGTTLRAQDPIRFELRDRDLRFDDAITTLSTRWDGGLPLELGDDKATVECRAPTAEIVRPRLEAAVAELATRLDALRRVTTPDRTRPSWGYPVEEAVEVQRELEAIAGLVGWAGPEARQGLAALATYDAKWDVAATPEVAEVTRGLPPAGSPVSIADGAVQARVSAFACGAQVATEHADTRIPHPDAKVTLRLDNPGDTDVAVDSALFWNYGLGSLVAPDGRDVTARLVAVNGAPSGAEVHVPPRGTTEIVLVGESGGHCPRLLRLEKPANTWIRLEP